MNDTRTELESNCTGSGGNGMLELLHVARVLQERIDAVLESVGLSVPKYQALDVLVRAGSPVPLSELASRQKCVRSNITQLVDRLEADGFVERTNDPEDRRAVRASITTAGKQQYDKATEAMADLQRVLGSRVSLEDRENFMRVLSVFGAG